jgi:hypothetical protein
MALLGPGPAVPPERVQSIFGSTVFGAGQPNGMVHDDPERGEDKEKSAQDDAELLREAREFLDYSDTQDSENRNRASEMLRFCYKRGSQWPDQIRRERERDNRPCLEYNQMPAFINQIANDERQNRPAIKVRGASDDATAKMAEIRQDLIRHIEYDSAADQSYDQAFRYAVAANMGYWRVVTEYESEDSFDQVLRVIPIKDIFSVHYDPDCVEPDGSDAGRCLVTEDISKDEFERRYPDAAPIDFSTTDPLITAWVKPDSIRIADWLHKVYYDDVLYFKHDGTTAWESDLGDEQPEGAYIDKKTVERCRIDWEVINGVEVLERHEWAGKFIPIVPVWGDVTNVDGEIIRQSLIERAVDAQQMYNFWMTTAAEIAAMQPKSPWIVAAEAIAGQEKNWGMANTKPFPYLTYRATSELGQPLPPPQRSSPNVDVGGMLDQANLCLQNMRQVIGIADPLQNMQVEDNQSGRAILAKERVASTSTFHFVDNLSRAIRYTGKVLLDLIPSIYDTQRTLQLLREDGSQYTAEVNTPKPQMPQIPGQAPPPPSPDDQEAAAQSNKINDLSTGRYDVVVDSGPSFASKRAEFVNSVMELSSANQSVWPAVGDLAVKHMDWPGAEDVSASLLALAPPQIQALRASKSKDPIVIGLGQQVQQLTQQLQQVQQQAAAKIQQMTTENQKMQSQIYAKDMQVTTEKGKTSQAVSAARNANLDAQADIITQKMEQQDVMAQEEGERERLEHEKIMDKARLGLELFDRLLHMAEIQQKQAQPVGPEVAGLNNEAVGVVKSDAAAIQ